jgi:hypothetical protein
MRFTVKHAIDTDEETFWEKIFFDEPFNRELCLGHLGFEVFQVLEMKREPDGVITRRIRNQPPAEIPAAVKKALGDSTSFVEEGRFDPAARRWRFRVIPAVAPDRIRTHGQLWVEPRGDRSVERVVEVETTVKVFGLGRVVEELIARQTRESYEQAALFTNRWIREKGL